MRYEVQRGPASDVLLRAGKSWAVYRPDAREALGFALVAGFPAALPPTTRPTARAVVLAIVHTTATDGLTRSVET